MIPEGTGPAEESICPFCEAPVWSDDEECLHCGASLVPGVCRHCREANPREALRCGLCGSPNLIRVAGAQVRPASATGPGRRFGRPALVAVAVGGVFCAALFARWKGIGSNAPVPRPLQALGGPVADFSLLDQNGRRQSLSVLADGRPMVLYGFSGDCGQCRDDLGLLVRAIGSKPPSGVVFVGLQHQGTPRAAAALREALHLPGSVLVDADGGACASLGVGEFTVFVLDRERRPVYRGGVAGMTEALASVAAFPGG